MVPGRGRKIGRSTTAGGPLARAMRSASSRYRPSARPARPSRSRSVSTRAASPRAPLPRLVFRRSASPRPPSRRSHSARASVEPPSRPASGSRNRRASTPWASSATERSRAPAAKCGPPSTAPAAEGGPVRGERGRDQGRPLAARPPGRERRGPRAGPSPDGERSARGPRRSSRAPPPRAPAPRGCRAGDRPSRRAPRRADRRPDDPFEPQDAIADEVSAALQVGVDEEERRAPGGRRGRDPVGRLPPYRCAQDLPLPRPTLSGGAARRPGTDRPPPRGSRPGSQRGGPHGVDRRRRPRRSRGRLRRR